MTIAVATLVIFIPIINQSMMIMLMIVFKISHKRLAFEALKRLITKVITMMKTIITMIIININIITRAGKRS